MTVYHRSGRKSIAIRVYVITSNETNYRWATFLFKRGLMKYIPGEYLKFLSPRGRLSFESYGNLLRKSSISPREENWWFLSICESIPIFWMSALEAYFSVKIWDVSLTLVNTSKAGLDLVRDNLLITISSPHYVSTLINLQCPVAMQITETSWPTLKLPV